MPQIIDKQTIIRFDKPGPRYTSYPTAPQWSNSVNAVDYTQILNRVGHSQKSLSVYVHIPFCQSMCTFCACSVIIRPADERYGDEYLTYLFHEIDLVQKAIGRKMKVKQLHLGGGTPTFLNGRQMKSLMSKLTDSFAVDWNEEVAIEIEPRTINDDKLELLKDLGFNRISMGIQDFDESVQRNINRIQPFKMVEHVFNVCRDLKFKSINFDLIYGLPGQTLKEFEHTISRVISLKPDRIALYSFAYVPWLKKHQQKIDVKTLPTNDQKLDIFLRAREQFLQNGYLAIAMDHFALKGDELAKAYEGDMLYRNFMGYTVKPADEYIGFGVSSIGFIDNTFIQNEKVLAKYFEQLKNGQLPVERGKKLTEDDQKRQWTINSLMCHFKLDKTAFLKQFGTDFDAYFDFEKSHLVSCEEDGLITQTDEKIIVSDLGKFFIRNVCMGFDYYLRQENSHKQFSRTV